MGSQTPMSSDRTRTYWTPAMEHYFIDLLIEHVHRGNRMGHTFTKQAWADMLSVFNANFESQYDKDVLKSRYTNLWKQFNDIKILLGLSGFSWDETRQMVVADDHVWDAYIKVHPDARPYKTKSGVNFNNLCLIYGYTSADGRYSRSSHDVENDEELQGATLSEGTGLLASQDKEHSRTSWTMDMERYFVELMMNQRERDNMLDTTFSKKAWTDILKLFNAKYGSQHTKRILRHRYKKLWKYYNDVTILLQQNGFSWDEEKQSVIADDDVWDAYIKESPQARSYRTKSLPVYNDLGLLFGDAYNNNFLNEQDKDKNHEDHFVGEKTGSERSRTYWTPPMDHYLIDLLLDQVHRGNRSGQTFIAQSWIDMVILFNENFKSQHDKDILKNRYKHLRKQYNDVTVLLEQAGFSWDEKREMVTAEDQVWDAYIEVHPESRSYRVKTVPGYQKLCDIFGVDPVDGRNHRLSSCVQSKINYNLIPTNESKYDQFPVDTNSVIEWTPEKTRYFIDLMLEQMHMGNKIDHTFVEQAWDEMITTFNKNFQSSYNRHVLENKFISWINEYTEIKNLLNHQGFIFDDCQQMITGDDDAWEAYSKDYPRAVSYKGKKLDYYTDLLTIFESKTTNEHVECENVEPKIDHTSLDTGFVELCQEQQFSDTGTERSDETQKGRSIQLESGRPSKLQKTGKDLQDSFSGTANSVNKKKEKDHMTVIVDALKALPGITDELILDACDILEDEKKAKTFLALDTSLRKKWLLRKLSCQKAI